MDKQLESLVAPYLDEGEEVQHLVRALEGPNRWIALLIGAVIGFPLGAFVGPPILTPLYMFVVWTRLFDRRLIVYTNRHVRLLKATFFRYRPKAEVVALPRETKVGPLKGVWMHTRIDGHRIAVIPRYSKIVELGDGQSGKPQPSTKRSAPVANPNRPVPPSAYRASKRLRK